MALGQGGRGPSPQTPHGAVGLAEGCRVPGPRNDTEVHGIELCRAGLARVGFNTKVAKGRR